MTVVFAGGEIECFTIVNPTAVGSNQNSDHHDPDYARATMFMEWPGQIKAVFDSALSEGWFHFRINRGFWTGSGNDNPMLELESSGGVKILRLDSDNGTWNLETWDGSAWVEQALVPEEHLVGDTTLTMDVFWSIDGTTGQFNLYIENSLVASFEGDTAGGTEGATGIAAAYLASASENAFSRFSEVIAADEDTRNWRLATLPANANGANTAWAGDVLDIDEVLAVGDAISDGDSDFISSDTADQIETYVMGDIPAVAEEHIVKAVAIGARAQRGDTGPQNLQGAIFVNSTDYASGNVPLLDTVFDGRSIIFNQNPDTAADWTQAEVNSVELGVKSIT